MDAVITGIKVKVLAYYPTMLTDLDITTEFLSLMVSDVVDRALIYTNRDQLVEQYEEDLVEFDDPEDDFWKGYEYPIPSRLYGTLAKAIFEATRTLKEHQTADSGEIASMSDNGQQVTYRDRLANYFSSGDDSKIFSGALSLLDNYRLATVVKDADSAIIQRQYSKGFPGQDYYPV